MTTPFEYLDALAAAVYTTDAEGGITYYNEAAAELWGHRPEIGNDYWCGSWKLFWPDGRPLPHDQCPMAIALREGRPVRGVEAVAERPDGTRVPFLPYPTPLRDATGRVTGGINLLVDLSDRKQAEVDSARLAAIVTSSQDAIVSKTLEGKVTSWNAGASFLFGYQADEMIGQSINRLIPDELHDEEKRILSAVSNGQRIDSYETVRQTKDGHRVDISLTVSPVRDKFGHIIGASKIARNITDRKKTEKFQALLVEELNHRIKNTLAMVQAIATQTLRSSKPSEFVPSFNGRIQALARAHALLTENKFEGGSVLDIVRDQIFLGGTVDHRISCSGPMVKLEPQVALHLALVIHELGTNARKYGALSVPTGRLSLRWSIVQNGKHTLLLQWRERGGPSAKMPGEQGFGTKLIERSLQSHGGETSIRFTPEGLMCDVKLPLPDSPQLDLTDSKPEASWELRQADAGSPILKGKHVLIVEDEVLISMVMEESLSDAGCTVLGPAGTLGKAKLLIESATFDAALLDANLDGRSVEEIATELQRRNVPFAFVTGYGREGLPAAFRDRIVISKPFSQSQLLSTVERLVGQ